MAGELKSLRDTLRNQVGGIWARLDTVKQELKKTVRSAWDTADPNYAVRVALSNLVKSAVASAYRSCMENPQTVAPAKCYADAAKSADLAGKIRAYWKGY
jgi:hypothetical protein